MQHMIEEDRWEEQFHYADMLIDVSHNETPIGARFWKP